MIYLELLTAEEFICIDMFLIQAVFDKLSKNNSESAFPTDAKLLVLLELRGCHAS